MKTSGKTDRALWLLLSLVILVGCNDEAEEVLQRDIHGMTQLHRVARANDVPAMTVLLHEFKVDPDLKDGSGVAPLHRAARDGFMDVVLTLLAYGADPNIETTTGWTPVQLAVRAGRTDMVRLFAKKGADVLSPCPNGDTPLSMSVKRGRHDLVNLLLVQKADPDETTAEGLPLIHQAVVNKDQLMVARLLGGGALIDRKDGRGRTPFQVAQLANDSEMMEFLWNKGAR